MNAPGINDLINNPSLTIGAALLGASAALREVREWWSKIWAFVQSKQGQAIVSDTVAAAQLAEKIAADLNHPANAQAQAFITQAAAFAASIPAAPTPPAPPAPPIGAKMVLFFALGLAALAGTVRAEANLGVGFIAVTPTSSILAAPLTGPLVVTLQPLYLQGFQTVGAGVTFAPEVDEVGAGAILLNWGHYNVGAAAGYDYDGANKESYGVVGIVTGVQPYGQLALLFRSTGALIGYSTPINLGAWVSTSPTATAP